MRSFAAGLLFVLAACVLAGAAVHVVDAFTPPTAAAIAADYARAERIRADAAWEPFRAALWHLVLAAAALGALAFLAALAAAYIERYRHERRPDARGLLPVPAGDEVTPVAALAGWHLARVEESRRPLHPTTPASVSYAPHYAPSWAPSWAQTLDLEQPAAAPAPPAPPAAAVAAAPALPGLVDLADVGHTPTPDSILLALGDGGERLTVPAHMLCHVALVGATGGGKSNLLRLLLPQLQAIGARVVLADPHHAPVDPENGDDWRPIVSRLHLAPARTADEIGALLDYLTGELERRLELRHRGERWGAPLFLALDELPVIADQVPGAVEGLGRLLREGRKVSLYSVGASQSMLVKVVGGDSSARECYRTAFYVGGDLRSAAVLLDVAQRELDEGALGAGLAYLRSRATNPARLVRVPLASNRAIRGMLEASAGGPEGAAGMPAGSLTPASAPQASRASLSPEAAQVLALFRSGVDPSQIVKRLRGVESHEGRRYQEALKDVHRLLREALS